MAITSTFHTSKKATSISNAAKLGKVQSHNSRGYFSFDYDATKIFDVFGKAENIGSDVRNFLNDTFGEAVSQYNEKQKRADRKIKTDAFTYFSDNKNLDIANEMLFQTADKDFWSRWRSEEICHTWKGKEYIKKSFPEEVKRVVIEISKRQMLAYENIYSLEKEAILDKITNVYADALMLIGSVDKDLKKHFDKMMAMDGKQRKIEFEKLPKDHRDLFCSYSEASTDAKNIEKLNLIERIKNDQMHIKLINGTVHFDEWSPHAHAVSVCWADGYKNGLGSRVAKSVVLNKWTLEIIQDKMHEIAREEIEKHPEIFGDETLQEKQKGRNHDYTTEEWIHKKQQEAEEMLRDYYGQAREMRADIAELGEIKDDIEYGQVVKKVDEDLQDLAESTQIFVEGMTDAELRTPKFIEYLKKIDRYLQNAAARIKAQIGHIRIFERKHPVPEPAAERQKDSLDNLIKAADTVRNNQSQGGPKRPRRSEWER